MSGVNLRQAADTALRRSPAQAYFTRRAAGRLAVLAYHGVDAPEQFDRHLELLVRLAAPVSLDHVVSALDGGPPLPRRAVLLTFDDGDPSVLREGLPRLVARDVPAVAFVIPGLLGSRTPFWWDEAQRLHAAGVRVPGAPDRVDELVRWLKTVSDHQRTDVLDRMRDDAPAALDLGSDQLDHADLRRLREGGVAIGNHTWTHPCLDRCTADEVERQVRLAHESLAEALGEAPTAFAYPNGNHDLRAEQLLRDLGYRVGFLFDHRLAPPPGTGDPLRISRLRVNSTTSLDRFATILSGLHPALHHARGGA